MLQFSKGLVIKYFYAVIETVFFYCCCCCCRMSIPSHGFPKCTVMCQATVLWSDLYRESNATGSWKDILVTVLKDLYLHFAKTRACWENKQLGCWWRIDPVSRKLYWHAHWECTQKLNWNSWKLCNYHAMFILASNLFSRVPHSNVCEYATCRLNFQRLSSFFCLLSMS